jgi:hypothetical protein
VRRRRAIPVLLGAVGVLVAVDVAAISSQPTRPGPARVGHADVTAGVLAPTPSPTATGVALSTFTEVLAQRAAAIRDHDAAALAALLDPAAGAFDAVQRTEAASIGQLPLAAFTLTPTSVRSVGGEAVVGVTLAYQIAGYDTAPLSATESDTYVHRGGRWLLAAVADATPEVWQYGPLTVFHGVRSLVVAVPGEVAMAPAIAAEVDRDVPAVTAFWGTDWPQRAVVLLPASSAQLSALTGERGDLSQITAVESSETGSPGARILINPPSWGRLNALGRRVTMTHELTHVASRAYTTSSSPTWLIEGFADAVAFAHAGLPTREIAAELGQQLRAGAGPSALPADAEFAAGNPDLAATYEASWLACTLIETRIGATGLDAFYRQVGASGLPEGAAVQAALLERLHLSLAQFTTLWLAVVDAQR